MKTKGVLLLCLLIVGLVTRAFGHHSTAMFNMGQPTTLEGTVKSFEWKNPHVYLYLDVVNAEGKSEEWMVEIHSPAIMLRRGYTKDYFKPGDKVTVVGGQVKDGTHMIRLLRGNKPDGTKFYGDDFAPVTTPTTTEK